MKYFVLLSLMISSNVFALDLCQLRDTHDFEVAVKAERIKPIRSIAQSFSTFEKQMIHQAVTLQNWQRGISPSNSLRAFRDIYDGYQGLNPGEIVYYQVKGQKLALVHYWPGENEYGAFFMVSSGSSKMIARIDDGDISCNL